MENLCLPVLAVHSAARLLSFAPLLQSERWTTLVRTATGQPEAGAYARTSTLRKNTALHKQNLQLQAKNILFTTFSFKKQEEYEL